MTDKKLCFVIMPISDQADYDKGHFNRVYEHLIKPACEKSGFLSVRADEESKTNFIVIDIIKKILESDIVLCDLSSKNPNVLYELGLRQAFNKKSVLIKDNKTSRMFDIQGLRTIDYDENLRIDEIKNKIDLIAKTLEDTYNSNGSEVNSLIQLLSIKPASFNDALELSQDSSLILDAISNISDKLNSIDLLKGYNSTNYRSSYVPLNGTEVAKIGSIIFDNDGKEIGKLVDFDEKGVFIDEKHGRIKLILRDDNEFKKLSIYPF